MILEEKNYLYLLLLLPILVVLFWYMKKWQQKATAMYADKSLFALLSHSKSNTKEIVKLVLFLLTITFLIVALANPKSGLKTEKIKSKGIDIIFAIDVSKSMLAEDVAPNRLERAKLIASQIISKLQGDRVGIIAYSGSAFPVLPITTDYAVAKMFLKNLDPSIISEQGTSIDQAIEMASESFNKKSKSSKVLVILSDGEDHSDNAESAAKAVAGNEIKIITVGLGTEKGAPIPLRDENGEVVSLQRDKDNNVVVSKRNSEVLKAIAQATQENYLDGNNTKQVVDYVEQKVGSYQKTENTMVQISRFESQFQWFLGFAIFLVLLDFFIHTTKNKNLYHAKQ